MYSHIFFVGIIVSVLASSGLFVKNEDGIFKPKFGPVMKRDLSQCTSPKNDNYGARAQLKEATECNGPMLENGFCKPLKECDKLLSLLKENTMDEALISYLRVSNKICRSTGTDVCCPIETKYEPTRVDLMLSSLQPNTCRMPHGDVGVCVALISCPVIQEQLQRFSTHWAQRYISMLQIGCGHKITSNNNPVICCIGSSEETINNPEEYAAMLLADDHEHLSQKRPQFIQDRTSGSFCHGPENENGFCQPLTTCSELWNQGLANPKDDRIKWYLQSSKFLCGSRGTNICCPSEERRKPDPNYVWRRFFTEAEGCGLQDRFLFEIGAVVGGEISHVGAWPWVALVGYTSKNQTSFKCGGVLITGRHVLTAAHCLRSDLTTVRLGEFDLRTDSEGSHEDITVYKMIRHPGYQKDGRNDLAILFLEKNVAINMFIRPICMPTSPQLRTKSYVGSEAFVAGWGLTKENGVASDLLRDVPVPIHNNSVCHKIYSDHKLLLSQDQFDDSVFCAGDLQGEKDSCKGDSGGPLMIEEDYEEDQRFYLLGTVSYGIGCGRAPGVYMRIQHFIDWIAEEIAET